MDEFCYDYMKLVYIKTEYIHEEIATDVEARFDISSYELERPLPKGKSKHSSD